MSHSSSKNGPYRHIVAFEFKPDATDNQIQTVIDDFETLTQYFTKDGLITGFEHGCNVSTEGFDQGLSHVFLVTFRDKAAFDIYLPHPKHKAYVESILPILVKPFVLDFVVTA